MFISKLSIDGYRNCCEKSQISFNKGLNILVGENASGKSTIIDALRLILKDQEQSYITEDDFYKSFTQDVKNNNIRIDVTLENLNQEEKITFLSWCNANFDAELHLEVEAIRVREDILKKVFGEANPKQVRLKKILLIL